MSTSPGSLDFGRFDELAEEFAERYRRGERPSLQEYVDRLPEMADEIREMFPALAQVEQVDEDAREDAHSPPEPALPRLKELGDYRILREVGRGGMGVVYEAEQISLGRRVALKVLPGHVAGDRKALERFRREAKAAARLHHTNIVPVFEVGRAGDTAFYAMQFIQGQGLDQVIDELGRLRSHAGKLAGKHHSVFGRRMAAVPDLESASTAAARSHNRALADMAQSLLSGRLVTEALSSSTGASCAVTEPDGSKPFDPSATTYADEWNAGESLIGASSGVDVSTSAVLPGGTAISSVDTSGRRQPFFRSVAQIGRQAAQGLAYAHTRGIVHRDIKPSNLLLDTAGVVWITDFGLAKADEDGLTATGDLLGTLRYMAPERFRGEGDVRADVYGLGLTLYELLTLKSAYDTSDRLKLIERIKNEEPARPRSVDGRIPRDLETIVLKAIDKDPVRRYATAEAMAEDLRRFLDDEPIRARQISASERYWRWARRNPVIAILGGVLTALLVAVTVGSLAVASRYGTIARSESLANARSQLDQKDAIKARRQAIRERDNSRRLSASLTFDRGIALAQAGQADRGLLWMREALKTAPEDTHEFRKTVRWNLGAWLGQVPKPLRIVDTGGACNCLRFSPDGSAFATGFSPLDHAVARPIDLWDTASGQKIASYPEAFSPFAWHPNGRVLVAWTDAWRRLSAIEIATRRVLWTTPRLPGEWGESIDFSPDGSTIIAARQEKQGHRSNTWFLQFEADTGRPRGEPRRYSWPMFVARDGKTFCTWHIAEGQAFVDLHELASGRRVASWPTGKPDVIELLISPDQKSLFGAVVEGHPWSRNSYFGQGWATGTGTPISPLIARTDYATYVPAADRVLTSTDYAMLLRDTDTWRVRGSGFPVQGVNRYVIASHPDGRTMLAVGGDNTVRLWQVSLDAAPVSDGATDAWARAIRSGADRERTGRSAFWSTLQANGKSAVSLAQSVAGRQMFNVTDLTAGRLAGRPLAHHTGWGIGSVAYSRDGRSIATGSNPGDRVAAEVRLWDAPTGRLLVPPMPHTNWVRALAFQPDGKAVAAGDYNGLVRYWDTSTGREIGRPLSQGEIVLSLAFSPDGKVLAVGLAKDHTGKPGVRLWDTATRQPIGDLLPSPDNVLRIDFRPDGRVLLASSGDFAGNAGAGTRVWDVSTRQAIGDVIHDEVAAGFGPDGRAFLTLGSDGAVKLRDAMTGHALATLLASSSAATCASFRGDGELVAAGFEDGAVRLFDLATSQPVGPPLSMRHSVRHVAFRPDGRSVAAIDEFGESRTWAVPEPLQDSSVQDLTLRIEARTGLRMEAGFGISRLGAAAWRERLAELEGLDSGAAQPDADPSWNEPMVIEAEQSGNLFAAIWHLDRLISARPNDWYLYARRARARSLSDELDKAAEDYQHAERLGKREDVLDFQVHCVVDCTRAERWAAALWYLDQLIAARPDDGMLHEDRAGVYGKLGREADRQAELARVFELGADEGLVVPRAEVLGGAGRWTEAASLLTKCGRKGPVSRELAQAWTIACLRAGDTAGYREACAAFLAREGPNPTVVWNAVAAASFLSLAPGAVADYRVPIAYFEQRLAAKPAPRGLYRRVFSNALGGLLLRAGRHDEAIARINEGIAAAKDIEVPTDWTYLALVHARQGDFAAARQSLGHLGSAPTDGSLTYWEIQEIDLLRGEAESLIGDAVFPRDPFERPRTR
jgi:serine/threonine protein kinase/WD40 repeat protein